MSSQLGSPSVGATIRRCRGNVLCRGNDRSRDKRVRLCRGNPRCRTSGIYPSRNSRKRACLTCLWLRAALWLIAFLHRFYCFQSALRDLRETAAELAVAGVAVAFDGAAAFASLARSTEELLPTCCSGSETAPPRRSCSASFFANWFRFLFFVRLSFFLVRGSCNWTAQCRWCLSSLLPYSGACSARSSLCHASCNCCAIIASRDVSQLNTSSSEAFARAVTSLRPESELEFAIASLGRNLALAGGGVSQDNRAGAKGGT